MNGKKRGIISGCYRAEPFAGAVHDFPIDKASAKIRVPLPFPK